MTAMQWLYRAWASEEEIEILKRLRQKELDRATKITPAYSAEGGGGSGDVHAKFDTYAELASVIEHRIEEIRHEKAEIITAISRVSDSRGRRLLMLRFVDCLTWEAIQKEMHYSQSQIKNIWKCARAEVLPIIRDMDPSVRDEPTWANKH